MKKMIIITTLLLAAKSFSQNSDLFRLWYLTKVTVESIDYIPTNYGHYPELEIYEYEGYIFFAIADPDNVTSSCDIEEFFTNPDSFTLSQFWFQIPTAMCYDGPDGPCTTIYGKHAEIYYNIFLPFIYTIEQNGDEFTLEIVNTEGNHAYYSSIPLSVDEFSQPQLTLYPNPVKYVLHIKSLDVINTISVFDIHGKVVKTVSVLNSNSSEIDLSRLQNGMYFITIFSENGEKLTRKVV